MCTFVPTLLTLVDFDDEGTVWNVLVAKSCAHTIFPVTYGIKTDVMDSRLIALGSVHSSLDTLGTHCFDLQGSEVW